MAEEGHISPDHQGANESVGLLDMVDDKESQKTRPRLSIRIKLGAYFGDGMMTRSWAFRVVVGVPYCALTAIFGAIHCIAFLILPHALAHLIYHCHGNAKYICGVSHGNGENLRWITTTVCTSSPDGFCAVCFWTMLFLWTGVSTRPIASCS
jgi:hypothetical protein